MIKFLLSKRATLLSIPCVIATFTAFAQAPAIEWQQSYGGTEADFMNVALSTSDGGYFLPGFIFFHHR
ncbi:MAG: hypothetical protein IPQ11_13805 [Bacteroidetes bacterium]|nr:hypothetical protein [Bacteroidota bacterium]